MAAQHANWLGVLRWSLNYSDGTRPSAFKAMSEEDKAFLMKVFDSMTVDEGKRMKELTDEIAGTSWAPRAGGAASASSDKRSDRPHQDAVADKLIGALEELQDFVDSIDNAKNLFVVGGFPALLLCLNIDAATDALGGSAATGTAAPGAYAACVRVATLAAEVLSTVVQNNPKAQGWALEGGACVVLTAAMLRAGRLLDHTVAAAAAAASAGSSAAKAGGAGTTSAAASSAGAAATHVQALNLYSALVTALSSLVRHSGDGQARLTRTLMVPEAVVNGTAATAAAGSADAGASAGGGGAFVQASPLDCVLAPLALWPAYCGRAGPSTLVAASSGAAAAAAGAAASTAALSPLACAKGRRLVRKVLFALRHLVGGVNGEAVKSLLLTSGSKPASGDAAAGAASSAAAAAAPAVVRQLLAVLHTLPSAAAASDTDAPTVPVAGAAASVATGFDDADCRDARESALAVLLALTQVADTATAVAVVDDSDSRVLASVAKGGVAKPAATASAERASALAGPRGHTVMSLGSAGAAMDADASAAPAAAAAATVEDEEDPVTALVNQAWDAELARIKAADPMASAAPTAVWVMRQTRIAEATVAAQRAGASAAAAAAAGDAIRAVVATVTPAPAAPDTGSGDGVVHMLMDRPAAEPAAASAPVAAAAPASAPVAAASGASAAGTTAGVASVAAAPVLSLRERMPILLAPALDMLPSLATHAAWCKAQQAVSADSVDANFDAEVAVSEKLAGRLQVLARVAAAVAK